MGGGTTSGGKWGDLLEGDPPITTALDPEPEPDEELQSFYRRGVFCFDSYTYSDGNKIPKKVYVVLSQVVRLETYGKTLHVHLTNKEELVFNYQKVRDLNSMIKQFIERLSEWQMAMLPCDVEPDDDKEPSEHG